MKIKQFWLSAFIPQSIFDNLNKSFPPVCDPYRASFAERMPPWVIYLPATIYWFILAVYYRSLTLPLIANPEMELSGFANDSKIKIFEQFKNKDDYPKQLLITHKKNMSKATLGKIIERENLQFPLIAKPDVGSKGFGVQLFDSTDPLYDYVKTYPIGEKILLNEFIDYIEEIGIFYVRYPNQQKGFIPSLTLKYPLLIKGDGVQTVKGHLRNISAGRRIFKVCQTYHGDDLNKIIPKDCYFRASILGSHRAGAIFKDGKDLIDGALTSRINIIAQSLPNFYFGRLDIKIRSLQDFKQGKNFKIMEVNGASSEMTHIWDNRYSLFYAWKMTVWHIHLLFKIGHLTRKMGYRPPKIALTLKAIFADLSRKKKYPLT